MYNLLNILPPAVKPWAKPKILLPDLECCGAVPLNHPASQKREDENLAHIAPNTSKPALGHRFYPYLLLAGYHEPQPG